MNSNQLMAALNTVQKGEAAIHIDGVPLVIRAEDIEYDPANGIINLISSAPPVGEVDSEPEIEVPASKSDGNFSSIFTKPKFTGLTES